MLVGAQGRAVAKGLGILCIAGVLASCSLTTAALRGRDSVANVHRRTDLVITVAAGLACGGLLLARERPDGFGAFVAVTANWSAQEQQSLQGAGATWSPVACSAATAALISTVYARYAMRSAEDDRARRADQRAADAAAAAVAARARVRLDLVLKREAQAQSQLAFVEQQTRQAQRDLADYQERLAAARNAEVVRQAAIGREQALRQAQLAQAERDLEVKCTAIAESEFTRRLEAWSQETQAQPAARSRRSTRFEPANPGAQFVRCNDGTRSKSCRCNRNNFQGCCSHHGGIAGC